MNFHELSRLRNHIITQSTRITVTVPREDRVGALLDIHKQVSAALADEGVVLPCHDDTPKEP